MEPCLEVRAKVLNINEGKNRDLLDKCRALKEYTIFVGKIREYAKTYRTKEEAIEKAVTYCIEHDVLRSILEREREKVMGMAVEELDVNEVWEMWREEFREDGYLEGMKEGRKENLALNARVFKAIQRGERENRRIAELCECTEEQVLEIRGAFGI